MASILLKDVPADLHRRLREAAARDHRSMNKEVIALLEQALDSKTPEPRAPIRARFPLTPDWLEGAISEGRSESGPSSERASRTDRRTR